jgi:tripartite-type tricarboxylate transporter receptor subunit TctC
MQQSHVSRWMMAAVFLFAAGNAVHGQPFPAKTIRVVVGGIGGSLDITARWVAQGISAPLGQPVIVENRPSVTLAADAVSKAAADGHTVVRSGA